MGALIQQSPGVGIREIDLTNYIPVSGISGGAFVGHFIWGPVLQNTVVSDVDAVIKYFGKPSESNYVDWFTAADFLAYTGDLNLVRVVDESNAKNATADGLGLLIKNDSHFHGLFGTNQSAVFAARYPGNIGNSLKVSMCDGPGFSTWEYRYQFEVAPGTSAFAASLNAENDEVHVVVVDEDGLFTGIPGAILEKYGFLSKALDAKNLDGALVFYGNVLNQQSYYVWYLGPPPNTAMSSNLHVSGATITAAGSGYSNATVAFTAAPVGGVTATGTVSVTPGFVDSINITEGGTGYLTPPIVVFGSPPVGGTQATGTAVLTGGVVTAINITNQGSGYIAAPTITIGAAPGGETDATATAVLGGSTVSAIVITNPGSGYLVAPTATISGNGSGATASVQTADVSSDNWAQNCISDDGDARKFASLQVAYSISLSGGALGSLPTADELITGWNLFRNSEEVDVSLLFVGYAGGPTHSKVVIQHVIDNIAEVRKDCVMFCSPDLDDVLNRSQSDAVSAITATRNALARSTNYGIMDSGWKLRYDQFADKYRWIPLNGDIAGLCAGTDATNDPWWSPAGYSRGRLKNVVSLAFNPNKTSRDDLYNANVNPVVTFTGDGTILYGDRTMQIKPSAFSYINVRRLFIVLEKSIARAAKYQLFEFNDRFTRGTFVSMITPFLRDVKGRRGIYDFHVVCDETNNTPEVIDRAEFVANIFVKPARSINFMTLNFVATRTGIDFQEVVGMV